VRLVRGHWHTQVRPRLVTLAVWGLHWLDVPERIHYKLGVTVHRCLQNKAPEYLVDCCTPVLDIPRDPADVVYAQPLDITWPYHVTNSALLVVGPSLFRQSPWPSAQQQQLQTQGDQPLVWKHAMWGNLTTVREMSGIILKFREMSGKKSCQGKVA